MKLLIFGLSQDTRAEQVQDLLSRLDRGCGAHPGEIRLQEVPGRRHEAVAIVGLSLDRFRLQRLSDRLNGRLLGHHRLQSWVMAMDWA